MSSSCPGLSVCRYRPEGVTAEVEFSSWELSGNDKCLLVMSDGVTEFISEANLVDMALSFESPLEACKALVGEAYRLWIKSEDRTDDITAIVVFVEGGLGEIGTDEVNVLVG